MANALETAMANNTHIVIETTSHRARGTMFLSLGNKGTDSYFRWGKKGPSGEYYLVNEEQAKKAEDIVGVTLRPRIKIEDLNKRWSSK